MATDESGTRVGRYAGSLMYGMTNGLVAGLAAGGASFPFLYYFGKMPAVAVYLVASVGFYIMSRSMIMPPRESFPGVPVDNAE